MSSFQDIQIRNKAVVKALSSAPIGNPPTGYLYVWFLENVLYVRTSEGITKNFPLSDVVLALNQSTKQTLSTSPIFGNLTPGRVVVVNTDGSLTDFPALTWNSSTGAFKIDGTIVLGDSQALFQKLGTIGLQIALANSGGEIRYLAGKHNLMSYISGAWVSSLYVSRDNGNVGIRTTTPTKKLHVAGDAGYVSEVDEGTGDTDFASHKFVNDSISAIVGSQTVTSSSTVTPTGNKRENEVYITAQSEALTIANPSGTAVNGNTLLIRIKDDGTARLITWGANYKAFIQSLPVTTIAGKYRYFGFIYNSQSSTWDLVSVVDEI